MKLAGPTSLKERKRRKKWSDKRRTLESSIVYRPFTYIVHKCLGRKSSLQVRSLVANSSRQLPLTLPYLPPATCYLPATFFPWFWQLSINQRVNVFQDLTYGDDPFKNGRESFRIPNVFALLPADMVSLTM